MILKRIIGFPNASVGDDGSIYVGDKILKLHDNGRGYKKVFLIDENGVKRSPRVHRLVAETLPGYISEVYKNINLAVKKNRHDYRTFYDAVKRGVKYKGRT